MPEDLLRYQLESSETVKVPFSAFMPCRLTAEFGFVKRRSGGKLCMLSIDDILFEISVNHV